MALMNFEDLPKLTEGSWMQTETNSLAMQTNPYLESAKKAPKIAWHLSRSPKPQKPECHKRQKKYL